MTPLTLTLALLLPGTARQEPSDLHRDWRARLELPPLVIEQVGLFALRLDELERAVDGDPEQRIEALTERLTAHRGDLVARLDLARALVEGGRADEAHGEFESLSATLTRALEADPEDWRKTAFLGEVMQAYGFAFHDLETLQRAERILHGLLEHVPDAWRASITLAELYLTQTIAHARDGRDDDLAAALVHALEHAEEAMANAPDRFRAHWMLFNVRWTELAISRPDASDARLVKAVDELTGDLRRAARLSDHPALVRGVADAVLVSALAASCTSTEDPRHTWTALPLAFRERAGALLEGLDPLAANALFGERARELSWLLAWLAERADASDRFEHAVSRARGAAPLIETRIELERRAGERGTVDRLGKRLLSERLDERTYALLARIEAACGDAARAEGHYQSALEIAPTDEHALVGLAVVRLRRGALPEDTLALLRRALARTDGRSPAAETRLAQGTVLALLGRYDPARAHLRAALAGLAPAVRRGAERTIAEVDALLD
jgi:tetratricopeptide (TPR) repeat protein